MQVLINQSVDIVDTLISDYMGAASEPAIGWELANYLVEVFEGEYD
jgi:hypothetical protein